MAIALILLFSFFAGYFAWFIANAARKLTKTVTRFDMDISSIQTD